MTETGLFSPFRLGPLALPNRIVMAPMTRNRAGPGEAPTALMATYYAQRASAGLIVTEGTQITPLGQGYPGTPGIFSPEQLDRWRHVTEEVFVHRGRIFSQLWHVGRVSHPLLQLDGALPVAPSALAPAGKLWTQQGMQSFVTPRTLETGEIASIVDDYRSAAANALAAGFDGVELHAANGYLIDQFLRDGSNRRIDRYGGSVANRVRLLIEVTEALIGEAGAARVGVRLSPTNPFNDMADSESGDAFRRRGRALDMSRLAYLHLVEPGPADPLARVDAAGWISSAPLAQRADAQQRLRSRARRCRARRRHSRSDFIRDAVHRQSGFARTPAPRRTLNQAGAQDVLWRRRRRLHGLSGIAGVALRCCSR